MARSSHKILQKSTDTLSYIERDGNHIPIIFLHGSGFSKEVFAKQFASEILADHRLIAVDLPGHGNSENAQNPKETYSYSGLADSIVEFIHELKIENCIVMGWSLGGQVALELVDNTPQVSGIMTCGAAPAANGALGLIQSMHISRMLLLAGKATFTNEDAIYFQKTGLGEFMEYDFTETLKRTDKAMRPNISRSVLYGTGASQAKRLKNATKPVCLLHGLNENFIRTSYMKTLANPMLHKGEPVFLDNSGHAPFADAPSEFDTVLKDFADAVEHGMMDTYSTEKITAEMGAKRF